MNKVQKLLSKMLLKELNKQSIIKSIQKMNNSIQETDNDELKKDYAALKTAIQKYINLADTPID